jgi:hypothetical protein
MMVAPRVYAAIAAVTAEFAQASIAKVHRNEVDQYLYRSIDDVLNRLSPLLAKHSLCILPRAVERIVLDRQGLGEALLVNVTLRVVYHIVSAKDGSTHTVEVFGEALDTGDKGTAKAMSAAYKGAMLQTFCIPVSHAEEPDAHSPKLVAIRHCEPPLQGWSQWTVDITDIIRSCESEEAVSRVQQRNRQLLQALGREQPEFYVQLGDVFSTRRRELQAKKPTPDGSLPARTAAHRARKGRPRHEPALA